MNFQMSEKSQQGLVSVIVIFLNAEKFLQEAIESIFAQTYDNWELLLVDDGSADGSTEIALQYAEQYPGKIRYLEHDGHQNRGMSASRNLGIRNSKGEYIAFLDADDVWLPHKLQQQVAILESQPEAAMVYGSALYWYSWSDDPEDAKHDFVQALDVQLNTMIEPPKLLTVFLRNEGATPSPSGILVRREVIEAVGGFEESFRGMHEDQAFYTKVCLKFPVFVASECWYRYRQHADACVSVAMNTGQYQSARLTFLNWVEDYLSMSGVEDGEVWSILQKELWPYHHPILHRMLQRARHHVRQMRELLKLMARQTLPVPVRSWLRIQQQRFSHWPPVGWVRFGSLRRLQPISRVFGLDRGLCIDRYYIENFLAQHAEDIQGHVLEIGEDTYTRRFGGERVTRSDVLHAVAGNPKATVVADLTCADHIPADTFDCIILTQTLLCIYDVRAALRHLYRILKPGGVLLATFPGISQISRYDMDRWGDYWRFTDASARRLFGDIFGPDSVTITTYGNVLAACAFLHGLAAHELKQEELDYHDPDYQVIITVRAVKSK
jgi:glycosyltransferase involved in cell wall biosynthesis